MRHVPHPSVPEYRAPIVGAVVNSEPEREAGDLDMGSLVFVCPVTRSRIESGIDMDRQTAWRLSHLGLRIDCRSCGCPHDFAVGDGRIGAFAPDRSSDAGSAPSFCSAA